MRKLLFIFLLIALILSACTEAPTTAPTNVPARATNPAIPPRPTPNAAERELSDPTKPIEVTAGSDFTITVRTNPSPDFHWEVAEALDSTIVEYVWKDHIPDDSDKPNSSGRDVWRFKAIGRGNTTITLGYYKGMSSTTPLKSIFTVVVK